MKLLFHRSYVVYKFQENFFAAVIGLTAGILASILDILIIFLNTLLIKYQLDYFFLLLVAIYATFSAYLEREAIIPGLILALHFLKENISVPLILWIVKFLGTALSVSVLPVGREGPAALLGTGLGQYLAHLFKLSKGKLNYWGTIGAAAFVGAFLKTPLGATFYIFENRFGKVLNVDFIINALTASTVSYTVFIYLRGAHPIIPVSGPFNWNILDIVPALLLGALASAVSIIMLFTYELTKKLAAIVPPTYRPLTIFPVILLLFTLVKNLPNIELTRLAVDYLPIREVSNYPLPIGDLTVAIALEIILLVLLLNFGYPGGIVLPLIFIGAALGNIVAHLDPDKLSVFALTGAAAMLCAAMNVPITAIVMISEMSHQTLIIPEIVGVITAYFLASSVKLLRR